MTINSGPGDTPDAADCHDVDVSLNFRMSGPFSRGEGRLRNTQPLKRTEGRQRVPELSEVAGPRRWAATRMTLRIPNTELKGA
jgi:hypothetical protein